LLPNFAHQLVLYVAKHLSSAAVPIERLLSPRRTAGMKGSIALVTYISAVYIHYHRIIVFIAAKHAVTAKISACSLLNRERRREKSRVRFMQQ
uniref:Secreted protein n=1 Tax=Dracunculus medinensis TaxID=318479 RepID=A0A0N4USA7_DRAME